MNFVEELKWRGMIHDIMPGTEEQLQKEMTTAYVGIDPTADSLHIGHLVSVMMLKHFQRAGHKPIALVGGATGMIGDPSMKSQERNLLDEKTLRHNQEAIKKQLSKFLDFESDAPNAAELVNNYDWMKNFSFLDFIRDVGKYITVNYMMSKDSVKRRLAGEGSNGLSFTEFSYQLVQGYDFTYLYKTKNCKLQMGGSDQWGNITTGTELIRRREIRKNRIRKRVARPTLYISIQILPILAECKRCRCRTLYQNIHSSQQRGNRRPYRRTTCCTTSAAYTKTVGKGNYDNGAFYRRL